MPWATPAQVEAITGVTVTQAVVNQAHELIELLVDRTEEQIGTDAALGTAPDWTGRAQDLRRLRHAVAFQAAFMTRSGADVHAGLGGVYQLSQPDLTVAFQAGVEDLRRTYAPLTLRACRMLTWRRNRSVPIASGPTRSAVDDTDEDLHDQRTRSSWVPLEGSL